MHRFKYAFLLAFLFFQLIGSAQVNFRDEFRIPLNKEQRLDSLIMLHKRLNLMNSTISGYRVQIYFESGNYSKSKALEAKKEFEAAYPNQNAYVTFDEPYYRVKVGDFRTKIEARGFLKEIIRKYPSAFEVEDMISLGIPR